MVRRSLLASLIACRSEFSLISTPRFSSSLIFKTESSASHQSNALIPSELCGSCIICIGLYRCKNSNIFFLPSQVVSAIIKSASRKKGHVSVMANPKLDLISGQRLRGNTFSAAAIGSFFVPQRPTGIAPRLEQVPGAQTRNTGQQFLFYFFWRFQDSLCSDHENLHCPGTQTNHLQFGS